MSAWSVEDETLYHKSSTTVPDWAMALETFDGDNVRSSSKDDSYARLFFCRNGGSDKIGLSSF